MADSFAQAWVEVLPDFKEFRSRANTQMSGILSTAGDVGGKSAKKGIGTGIVGGIAGAAAFGLVNAAADIGRVIGESIGTGINYALDGVDLASSLAETESAVGQVFGDASADVLEFSKTANTALGATRQEALEGAKTFGIFGKAAKLEGADLANFSTGLVGLATDLGSFNNTSTADAIAAIGAGLRGESEPLRAYGVLLDDATLRNEALRLGLIKTTKEALTPQQRVLAAQAAIYAQTSLQQGDFARTSGQAANQQKILAASFTEAQTALGDALLPSMTQLLVLANDELVPALNDVIAKVGPELATSLVDSLPAIQELVETVAPLLPQFVELATDSLPLLFSILQVGIPFVLSMAQAGRDIFNAWTTVDVFFKRLPARIGASVGNMANTLVQAGKDLINGLIRGAQSKLKDIGTYFANVLPAALREPFKDALGIHSPSTVFAAYGRNIGEGVIVGTNQMRSQIGSSVRSLVTVPRVPSLAADVSGYGSSAASAGGSSDQPIFTDAGALIGWLRRAANGQARLVFNELMNDFALDNNAGGLAV